ncbi:hypothetical protein GNI_021380 [Gregarina niphandrodes]|uniref:Uncharacterized protein n=1 Tax=Gregarina niphandrodes TaxID=110365 RepID=A0A023BBR6_GRENI|nr:hypothetical protein GNI_021380 [Gregarina niphandrodes]EZG80524.1 hypothetical protein GNI_021380 [Gregarina niphandrodes]|eukprot:XP_011134294.1 hypothetical protein GNI_021380 [Gregarina niphandrodes]
MDVNLGPLAEQLMYTAYGRDQLLPQTPVSLNIVPRRNVGYQVDLTARYRAALATVADPNVQEPVRAQTDRDSDFYKYSVLAWWRKFGGNDPMLGFHSELDRLLRYMLYIASYYGCTNQFLVSDLAPMYTHTILVYAGVARIDVEVITMRELLRGGTPDANDRRRRVRDETTAPVYTPKVLECPRVPWHEPSVEREQTQKRPRLRYASRLARMSSAEQRLECGAGNKLIQTACICVGKQTIGDHSLELMEFDAASY